MSAHRGRIGSHGGVLVADHGGGRMKPLHIGVTSVLFDAKPEGICTGRLVRALLERGHRVTLLTSAKARKEFSHPGLRRIVASHRPRFPRWPFKLLAALQGNIYNNFYLWSQRLLRADLQGDVPDLFYGRAWPHASIVPAYELALRYQRPLALHFSDPFPAPTEEIDMDYRFFSNLQRMVDAADLLTFTNEETIAYQHRFLRFDEERAFVLNHVAPPPQLTGAPGVEGGFYYLGTVGPTRPARLLLEGFARHIQKFKQHRLYFVGSSKDYLMPEIRALGLSGKVQVLPFTSDLLGVYQRAGVLVSIDALTSEPLYTPTKIIDYLMTDRPVLCLTPAGSPVGKLVARFPETILPVTDYTPEAVATGMEAICAIPWDPSMYARRMEAMRDFSGAEVAKRFENKVATL
jgi:glycosyltransferase involved in cell wall biosynthesis